jgi:hypothetical protein
LQVAAQFARINHPLDEQSVAIASEIHSVVIIRVSVIRVRDSIP